MKASTTGAVAIKEDQMRSAETRTIRIPPYLTLWDLENEISRCMRMMEQNADIYLLDMSSVKNVYSATARLIMRLRDRTARLGAQLYVINAQQPVENALRKLEIDSHVPIVTDGSAGVLAA